MRVLTRLFRADALFQTWRKASCWLTRRCSCVAGVQKLISFHAFARASQAYLQYLQYWLQPPYARFVSYPAALDMLRHLQSPVFRATMANPDATEHVWRQTFFQWQFAMRGLQAQQAEPYAAVAEAEGAAGATLEQTQAAAEPGAVAQAPPAVAAAVEAGAVGSERAAPAAGEKRKRDDS